MAMCDIFVLLDNVQFEKNGYQNRFKYRGKWITMPVEAGLEKINQKKYVNGQNVSDLNFMWIEAIRRTLSIKTEIRSPYTVQELGLKVIDHDVDWAPKDPTERLIYIIKNKEADVYVTNPEAKDKYLNEDLMRSQGIDIEYCKVPRHLQVSTFEAIERYGIEGLRKQLPKRRESEKLAAVL